MLRLLILIWYGSAIGNVQQRYLNYMDSFSNRIAFSARPTASVSEAELFEPLDSSLEGVSALLRICVSLFC